VVRTGASDVSGDPAAPAPEVAATTPAAIAAARPAPEAAAPAPDGIAAAAPAPHAGTAARPAPEAMATAGSVAGPAARPRSWHAAVAGGLPAGPALLTALAGGLVLAAAFPPVGAWPLAAVGPALLTVALWRRSLRGSLAVGLVFGFAFFIPLLSWLVNVAWYVWAALAVVEAVMFGVLAVGQRLLLNLRAWPLAVAGWWVAAEALRDRTPFGGFPWGRLAMSQAAAPTGPWVAVGGAPLLTFLVALAASTLAWLVLAPPRAEAPAGSSHRETPQPSPMSPASPRGQGLGRRLRPRMVPALAFAAAAAVAVCGAVLPVDQPAAGTPTATVAAVQGNVPHAGTLSGVLRASTVTANHAAETRKLAAQVENGSRPAPDVVIWPENSTDLDPSFYPSVYGTIAAAVRAINRPVLVGAVLDDPVRNAGQLWRPGRGPVESYVKRQLVPFGEVIPFRSVLDKFTSLPSLQPVNFTPGHRAVVFRIGKIRLGDVICYEVGFDSLVRSEVAAKANLLVVQTNDADFEIDGQTGETLQQLAIARIRAMEHDRSVVVASTTGVSAIIAPDGSVIARSGTWRPAILDARVPLVTHMTLADRVGSWPELVITFLVLAALAWVIAGAASRRARPRRTGASAAE
jgi:apolipoprotein N-acyltransferase